MGERVRAVEVRADKLEERVSDLEDTQTASGDRSMQLRVAIVGLLGTTLAAVIGLISAVLLSGTHT